MSELPGGGASVTTEEAAGSSSGTDVSLDRYLGSEIRHLKELVTAEISALRAETAAATANQKEAVGIALTSAKELSGAHNDLLRKMEKQQETYETKDEAGRLRDELKSEVGAIRKFQYTLTGGLLVVSFIGVTNLIRIGVG